MKTKEFIRRVEELGFTIWITGNTAYILEDNEQKLIRVAVNKAFVFDYIYLMNESIDVGIKEKLFDLVVEYVKTPIKDREEEKKFYLRHKFLCDNSGIRLYDNSGIRLYDVYLNYRCTDDKYFIHNLEQNENIKTKFTLKEIEEIKEKFNTDLADFELVEVED